MWLVVRASIVEGVVHGKSQWGVLWSCAWVKTLLQVVGGNEWRCGVVVCGREDDLIHCSEITTILQQGSREGETINTIDPESISV